MEPRVTYPDLQIHPGVRNAVLVDRHSRVSFAEIGKKKYPFGAILHYDADIDAFSEQTGGPHTFNHAILSPQYQRNADGSYVNVGARPAVDTFDGKRWLRSCGAITNLFGGDTSQARSVSLTNGTVYTLHVFGAGTVSCSYGTATVEAPLKITATATESVTFTPDGATYWMLTATSYPVPYVPPGVTQPASNATTTNGSWFSLPDGSPLWQALTGSPLTLATRVRMGVGSGDLPMSMSAFILHNGGATEQLRFYKTTAGRFSTNDGTSQVFIAAEWPANTPITIVAQVNTAVTQYRVGYMIEGTHTTIQWSEWRAFDGSFNPSTLYRLMLGFNNPYPMWYNKITAWKEQVSDARILEAMA